MSKETTAQREWRKRNREKIAKTSREYYHKNKHKQEFKDKLKLRNIKSREYRRAKDKVRGREYTKFLQDYKLEKGCKDCGYNAHPAALDFDHLGDKDFNLSSPPNKSDKTRILQEIAKCEVVCANCHRIRTVERRRIKPYTDNDFAEVQSESSEV